MPAQSHWRLLASSSRRRGRRQTHALGCSVLGRVPRKRRWYGREAASRGGGGASLSGACGGRASGYERLVAVGV